MTDENAVIDLDVARRRAAVRDAFAAYLDAQDTAQRRRYELGRALMDIRPMWPERGPNAKGWGDFLAAEGIDQDVALIAMKYAGYVEANVPEVSRELSGNLPTLVEAGLRAPREPAPLPPRAAELGAPPAEPDVPRLEVAVPEVEIDRDTWCTPKWITDALGEVDLDPCANERSHVHALETYRLDQGADGLELAVGVDDTARVFINPPYSNVRPWVAAYKHTRFAFLLKLDPSTKWFAELFEATALILIPRGTRIEFEAPPEVPPEKSGANQFPHALFFAHAEDAPLALLDACFVWITNHTKETYQ